MSTATATITVRLVVVGGTGYCGRAFVKQVLQWNKNNFECQEIKRSESSKSVDDNNANIAENDAAIINTTAAGASGSNCNNVNFQLTLFCRDEQRAKSLFSSSSSRTEDIGTNTHDKLNGNAIRYIQGDIYNPKDVADACFVHNNETDKDIIIIINCLSSYKPPHTQMSTLIRHVISALSTSFHEGQQQHHHQQQQELSVTNKSERRKVFLVHYGFPRGHKYYNLATLSLQQELTNTQHQRQQQQLMGTTMEHFITSLVKLCSLTKYGPAIRDHERVLDQLLDLERQNNDEMSKATMTTATATRTSPSSSCLEYCIFAAPNMITPTSRRDENTMKNVTKNSNYYGGPGSVEKGIRNSRVWHGISTYDAADMILSHLSKAVVSQNNQASSSKVTAATIMEDDESIMAKSPPSEVCSNLPRLVCLSYI